MLCILQYLLYQLCVFDFHFPSFGGEVVSIASVVSLSTMVEYFLRVFMTGVQPTLRQHLAIPFHFHYTFLESLHELYVLSVDYFAFLDGFLAKPMDFH